MSFLSTDLNTFETLMVRTMGFQRSVVDNEVCWTTNVPRTPYVIQVRSGFDVDGNSLPPPLLGIRLYLLDSRTLESIVPFVRIRRTQHALRNVREKVGLLWRQALDIHKGKVVRR
jgi:hypothetical protein